MHLNENPFLRFAGGRPPEILGSGDEVDAALVACKRLLGGRAARPMLLLGPRGSGKTVLLKEIGDFAAQSNYLVLRLEVSSGASYGAALLADIERVPAAFSRLADWRSAASDRLEATGGAVAILPNESEPSGSLETDLADRFEAVGNAARAIGMGWLLLVDELQNLSKADLAALLAALHRVNQLALPVMFVGAGLPNAARLVAEAKAYAERLLFFCDLKPLSPKAIKSVLVTSFKKAGASIAPNALDVMVKESLGSPLLLRIWAACVWEMSRGQVITMRDVELAKADAFDEIAHDVFRFDCLDARERAFLQAMVVLGDDSLRLNDIRAALMLAPHAAAALKRRLVRKGFIYSPCRGYVAFASALIPVIQRAVKPLRSRGGYKAHRA